MRRFELWRKEDETGISGTGHVASGIEFDDGECVMRWNTERTSTATYRNIEDLVAIHGHGGKTYVFWLDPPKYDHQTDKDMELEGLCLQCFGGPYDNRDGSPGRYHHCYDCGASNYVVFLPRYAVKAIRKKDKQRCEGHLEKAKELEWLRGMLPVPDFVKVRPNEMPDHYNEAERARYAEMYEDSWWVSVGNYATTVKAKTREEARALGATKLSWLPYHPG